MVSSCACRRMAPICYESRTVVCLYPSARLLWHVLLWDKRGNRRGLLQAPACGVALTRMFCAAAAGKGSERGVARPEVLQSLLGSCERVVQEIDSVEYGLTDIQVGLEATLLCLCLCVCWCDCVSVCWCRRLTAWSTG
jgi:hypothetical protein